MNTSKETNLGGAPVDPLTSQGPTLVVLAAGMGSRFGGLKQLTPINAAGESILHYSVYDAMRAGFKQVVFVIRREIEEAFRAGIGSPFGQRVEVAYAFQELGSLLQGLAPAARTKPWGTLQATLVGAESVAGPFAVINADDFYGADSFRVLARHLQTDSMRSAMVGYWLRNTLSSNGSVSRGVCRVSADSLLLRVDERKGIVPQGSGAVDTATDGTRTMLTGDEVVSMNMWGFQPSVVPVLREDFRVFLETRGDDLTAEAYLPEAVNGMVSTGEAIVAVLHTEAVWCGMTYREDYPDVVEHIRQLTRAGEYPEQLWT